MTEAQLRLTGLRKSFGACEALKGVDLTVSLESLSFYLAQGIDVEN